jgi:DNA-binding NtrC family response regulator
MPVALMQTPHSTALRDALSGRAPSTQPAVEPNIPQRAAEILPPRVLVVDDEALLRWSLAEMLSAVGYTVVEARDGREARLAFADTDHPIDAVLLDLKLPDATGLQLLREARARCLTCPIIVMTAFGAAETVDAALAGGAVKVVTKPFDLDDMLRLVRQVCPFE